MIISPDWLSMEDEIANLLAPEAAEQDRATLLAKLTGYAHAVVEQARRQEAAPPTAGERKSASAWLERPVFVCGHHRTGTTLLQELLDGHPELLVLPSEGAYFSSFRYVAQPNPSVSDIDRFAAEWVARFVDPNFDPHFKLGRSQPFLSPSVRFVQRLLGWQAALLDGERPVAAFSPMLALAAAFRDVAAAHCAPHLWVEKTPLNEFHVDRLAAFPQARFIHMVREPSATLSSLLELYRTAGIARFNRAEHTHSIAQSMRQARRNQRRYPERYLIVRYEDLTAEPSREMERVRAFLGISAHRSLTIPTVGGHPVRSNSSFERGEAGVVRRRSPPALSTADATLVAALAADVARQFGYSTASLPMPRRYAIRLRHLPANALRRIRGHLLRLRLFY
jgi:Sulfotransferase family